MNSSNFLPLRTRWPNIYQHAAFAEQYAHTDPHTVAVKLRCFAEEFVGFLYKELRLPSEPSDAFFDKLNSPHFRDVVSEAVLQKLHAIRMLGNRAAHGGSIDTRTSVPLIEEAYLLGRWLYKTYNSDSTGPYPTYEPPTKPAEHSADQSETAAVLAGRLKAAMEELSRLETSERASQSKIAALGLALDEAKLLEFKTASTKAAETIEFKAANTRRLVNIHDAFAAYALTSGQAELVKHLEQFLDSKTESVFLLKGYAGTGKTFITKGLTEYFQAIGRNYVLAAPTGKASKVIATKTQSPAYTIHKSIYSFDDIAEYRDDADGTETYKFYAKLAVNTLSVDTVFIVDEASMISNIYQEAEFFRFGTGYLLTDFLNFVNLDHNDHTKKVIFIGDDAQLPPVGMNFSPALDAGYLYRELNIRSTGFELSEVVRQKAKSGVIANAIPLRKALAAKSFNQLTIDFSNNDVKKISHAELIECYIESCGGKINGESIVIAHSNSDVSDYNQRIREYFFPNHPEITQGDKVMSVVNRDIGGIFISNGDFGKIQKVISEPQIRTVTLIAKNPESGELIKKPISICFRSVIAGFKDQNGKAHFFETKIIEDLLYSKEPTLSSDQNKALYLDFCIRNSDLKRNSVEFKHTLKADPYFNALQLKFGYAITCHKAQGSEWNNVFVKCKSHQRQLTADYFRWLYTAITRTAKNLYLLDPPNIRPWSDIKIIENPTLGMLQAAKVSDSLSTAHVSSTQPNSTSSPQASNTFGIPESATILLSLLSEVRRLTDGKGIAVEDVHHNQWQESYRFTRGIESARVDITYTSKNKISSVAAHGLGGLSTELADLLSPLKGRPLLANRDSAVTGVSFAKQFLNDFHEKVIELCGTNGITVQNVIEQQWSLRYTFTKNGSVSVYDVFYNGRDQITRCQPVVTACSPGPLTAAVGQLLTEGLKG